MRYCALVLGFFAATCLGAGPERVLIPSADGKLQLPGYWFEAKGAAPRPAVISLHGCGGAYDSKGQLGPVYARDAGVFNAGGVHLLALDSFTPRGLKSICEIAPRQRGVDEDDRRADVYAAIRWLAQRPEVDASRIALVGRSHGGQTVLSAMDAGSSMVKGQPLRPRAAVALYPGCRKYARMRSYEIAGPLLVLIGEKDDWTPAQRCVELRDKLARTQPDAPFEVVVYPDSYHGFDGRAPIRVRGNIATTRSGTATVGGNPETGEEARRKMLEFLSAQLAVPLQAFGTRPMR